MSGSFDDDTSAEARSELIGEALASSEVELDLLLRHARAPESLSAEERARVEAYLAASPAHRDRARVMARLADSGAPVQSLLEGGAGSAEEASEAAQGGAEVIPLSSRWRVNAPRLAMAASILLMLTIAGLYLSRLSEGGRPPAERVAERAPESPQTPEEPSAPSDPTTPSGPEPATRLAEQSTPEPVNPERPTTPEGSETAPPPLLAETPSAPAPETAPPPEPSSLAEAEPPPSPPPALPEPAGEEILLAALLDAGPYAYDTPPGMIEDVRLMGFGRSGGPALSLAPLAPAHVGRTRRATPTLRWYVSQDVDAGQEIAILDPATRQPIVTMQRPAPTRAGFHALELAEEGIRLAPEVDYRWVVAVVHDPDRRARDTVAAAEVRYTPEAGAAASALPMAERGPALARAGLWYDALDVISQAVELHSESAELRGLRADLLESVGLGDAAARDREATSGAGP